MKLIKTIPLLFVAALAGCRDLDAEYFVPLGHPADPGSASAPAIALPPLEPASEDVRPKISLRFGPGSSVISSGALPIERRRA